MVFKTHARQAAEIGQICRRKTKKIASTEVTNPRGEDEHHETLSVRRTLRNTFCNTFCKHFLCTFCCDVAQGAQIIYCTYVSHLYKHTPVAWTDYFRLTRWRARLRAISESTYRRATTRLSRWDLRSRRRIRIYEVLMKHRRSDHTAFVDRNHVLDIDEGIRFDRGVLLDQYESLCNQISDIVLLPL